MKLLKNIWNDLVYIYVNNVTAQIFFECITKIQM